MAKFVLRNAFLEVNAVNLSDHASSVTVESTAEEVDFTAFTASGYREFGQGFKDATITATFFQDFAASSVDATLQPLYDNGSTFAVKVRSDAAAISSTNPMYMLGTARMFSWSPIAGGVGDASSTDVTFRNAGTAGLTRHTS